MVKRYSYKLNSMTGHTHLEENANGEWVAYEDYARLLEKTVRLLEALRAEEDVCD